MVTTNLDETSQLPGDRAELLRRIQAEWSALEKILSLLRADQMQVADEGGWSIKDHLSHLASWERILRLHHMGKQPLYEVIQVDKATVEALDEDGINEIIRQRNATRPALAVIQDLRRTHERVVSDLEHLTYEELMKPRYEGDTQAGPLINWVIGNTYQHYQEHRAVIEKLVK